MPRRRTTTTESPTDVDPGLLILKHYERVFSAGTAEPESHPPAADDAPLVPPAAAPRRGRRVEASEPDLPTVGPATGADPAPRDGGWRLLTPAKVAVHADLLSAVKAIRPHLARMGAIVAPERALDACQALGALDRAVKAAEAADL